MQRCSESEFLEFRQRIKESIRKNTQVENDIAPNSEQSKRNPPYNDFGSFFGPSQTVIAPRVLRESKPMFENKLLTEKMLNSIQTKKSSGSGTKNPKEELKRKVEKLKDSRDYSFLLSDDAKLPVLKEEPLSQNPATPNPRPDSSGSQLQPRPGSSTNGQAKMKKVSSVNSQTHRKSSKLSPQRADSVPRSQTCQRPLTSSKPLTCVPRSQTSQRPLTSSKPLTCVPRNQGVKQRKVSQEVTLSPSKSISSKPPLKRQPHQLKKKLKKKMSKDDELALEMVRKMCNTDRYKGRDFDDYDDENMETNFQDLIKEEKRSEKLAKKEDAEQLRIFLKLYTTCSMKFLKEGKNLKQRLCLYEVTSISSSSKGTKNGDLVAFACKKIW
ncbi:unnamed protein product [Arabis nemorensis]|uniref:Uncharacterized protein n=1 Tax=Arabis nemorensis TaxID=586526 RepID=A0A565C8C3_9BRAS|nr:unnamed protein product [Arabis nemorensis]